MKVLSYKIKDIKVQELCDIILKSGSDIGKGIPIGNLTSQLFANVYLDVLDKYIKNNFSNIGYIRYMDDFLIFGNSKEELHSIKFSVEGFLQKELLLKLHPKKAVISPVVAGVSFLGYIIFETHTRLRKSTVKRFVKRVKIFKDNQNTVLISSEKKLEREKKFKEGIRSWFVYAGYSSSSSLIISLNKRNNFLEYINNFEL